MDMPPIAPLVDALFKTHRKPDGREYSTYEVAREMAERGLGEISPGYLAKLRRGETSNPSREVLSRLCLFFRVPASYFFPELDQLVPSLDDSNSDPLAQVRVAFRAAGLAPDEQAQLEGLFELLRRRNKRQIGE
jgi:transcriptional regulator with XRE-family HTH domain